MSTPRVTSAARSGRVGRATVFLLASGVGGTHQPDDGQHCDSTAMRPVGQALIRSLRRTGGAEDTRPARPTDPIHGTRPVDPRVRPADRAPRPSSSQWLQADTTSRCPPWCSLVHASLLADRVAASAGVWPRKYAATA